MLDVASHRARLPGIRVALEPDEILDGRRMAALLAAQPAETDPRAASASITRSPTDGSAASSFAAWTVAAWAASSPRKWPGPWGSTSGSDCRPTSSRGSRSWPTRRTGGVPTDGIPEEIDRDELLSRVLNNPPLFPPGRIPWNAAAWHRSEIPGAGGIATARSIARLYGCLALGGELEGIRLLSADTLKRGRRGCSRRWDPLARAHQAFAFGFEVQTSLSPLGPAPDAFGHRGAGGSVHCAWPSLRAGVSYAMNLMRDAPDVDPRGKALLDAAHACLPAPDGRRAGFA